MKMKRLGRRSANDALARRQVDAAGAARRSRAAPIQLASIQCRASRIGTVRLIERLEIRHAPARRARAFHNGAWKSDAKERRVEEKREISN